MSNSSLSQKYSELIKEEAHRLGFQFCGFSKAEFLSQEAPRLEAWLKQQKHGKMGYMENHFDKRLDPTKLVPEAKSVVSLLLNYFPKETQKKDVPKISKYAYGMDYHFVIKDKLKALLQFIHEDIGEVNGRVFVDSAPVMDKVWAAKSGLGWIGKHSNLINKQQGSFLFVAELILDLELEYNTQTPTDHCGTCTACIDACPTDAIVQPYVVDGSKCISYFTIELKDELLPKEMRGKFENWAFGCDLCQDVCPWNRFSKPHNEPLFNPHPELLNMTKNEWHEMTEEIFQKLFKNSAVKRTKFTGLKRNLKFIEA